MVHGAAVSLDGVSVAYEAHGDGAPALVFVHGWSCDRTYWAGQVEAFAREFRVIALDLGGHGESGAERASWTVEAFAADVAAVVDKLDLDRVVLIAHSIAGDIIVEAARQLRGRVIGLVWVDACKRLGVFRTPEQLRALLAPLEADFVEQTRTWVRGLFGPNCDQALVERVALDMSAAPSEVARGMLALGKAHDRKTAVTLKELKLPIIAINGVDEPTDIASMHHYGVDVVLMPNVGHFPMLENPDGFNAFLMKAIERLQDTGTTAA